MKEVLEATGWASRKRRLLRRRDFRGGALSTGRGLLLRLGRRGGAKSRPLGVTWENEG